MAKRKKKAEGGGGGAKTLEFIVVYDDQLQQTFKRQKGEYGFAPKCHPDAPCKALFKNGKLNVDCSECHIHMLEFAIQEDDDFQIIPCDHHPDDYGKVKIQYDGKKLKILCHCGKVLHKLKVNG